MYLISVSYRQIFKINFLDIVYASRHLPRRINKFIVIVIVIHCLNEWIFIRKLIILIG